MHVAKVAYKKHLLLTHISDMLIGYARVSTDDQGLRLQHTALKEVGCRRTVEEKVSGAKRDRPKLARLLDQIREEDVVVVTRRDRPARSTKDLLDIAEKLNDAGAGFRSLAEPWADTTTRPDPQISATTLSGWQLFLESRSVVTKQGLRHESLAHTASPSKRANARP